MINLNERLAWAGRGPASAIIPGMLGTNENGAGKSRAVSVFRYLAEATIARPLSLSPCGSAGRPAPARRREQEAQTELEVVRVEIVELVVGARSAAGAATRRTAEHFRGVDVAHVQIAIGQLDLDIVGHVV